MNDSSKWAAMFSSKTDLWATPPDFYEKLNAEFHFTLDPCASDSNHKTERYFTVVDDGLLQSWDGETVFMNPPYGRDIGLWMKKASETRGVVVCLVPARTDTRWWHDYVMSRATEVRFVKGRLKFGGSSQSAPFPSAVIVYNPYSTDRSMIAARGGEMKNNIDERSCQLEDIRFTASLYASTTVDEEGNPDTDELTATFIALCNEWGEDKDPYWCDYCSCEFHSWEAVKDHIGSEVAA